MSHKPTHKVPFRRRREGKTDYRARLKLIRSGSPRLVVRRTLNHTTIQLVTYDEKGDRVIVSASTGHLRELGWAFATGNTPAAYLAGLMAGRRAFKASVTEAILDLGRIRPSKGSRVFAALKGVIDAGVEVPHSDEVLPSEQRIKGAHLNKPEIAKNFDEVRQKIING
jgi:large subunit ribosomal protein L18